jgi:hypothetical protein
MERVWVAGKSEGEKVVETVEIMEQIKKNTGRQMHWSIS